MKFFSKKIKATSPKGAVVIRFRPLKTFESKDMRSVYIQGEIYFLREGNSRLKEQLVHWVGADLVEFLED